MGTKGNKKSGGLGALLPVIVIVGILVIILLVSYFGWAFLQSGTYRIAFNGEKLNPARAVEFKPFGSCTIYYTVTETKTEVKNKDGKPEVKTEVEYSDGKEYSYNPADANVFSNCGIFEIKDDNDNIIMLLKRAGDELVSISPANFDAENKSIVRNDDVYEITNNGALTQIVTTDDKFITFGEVKGDPFKKVEGYHVYERIDTDYITNLLVRIDGTYKNINVKKYDVTKDMNVYEIVKSGEFQQIIVCGKDDSVAIPEIGKTFESGKGMEIVKTETGYNIYTTEEQKDSNGKKLEPLKTLVQTVTLDGDEYVIEDVKD
ncbi:MAG: hypothetical protein E7478_03055 [Ruminococcaceae bacterium]|nr:hypothetical protein [Oscillospiraceae bacterium]